MSSVNKSILVGNVGKDPNVRTGQSGRKFASFSVATSERWKDKETGERNERTHWHNVVVFKEDLAEFAEKNIRKGTKVYMEGSMQTRKWSDGGVDKYITEVVVNGFGCQLMLAEGRGPSDGGGYHGPDPDEDGYGSAKQSTGAGKSSAPVDDEDIPF